MFENIKKIFAQIGEPFKQIPLGKKVVILVISGLVMTGFLFLIFWAQRPEYKLLFSNLSPEDSSAIIEKLKTQNVDYKIVENGKAILVPTDLVYELRLQLASDGIPRSSGSGFELFDKTVFGMTEFVQKLNFLRGLQGELSRTISRIEEVDQARVHIVIPKDKLFEEDQKKTTASIVLKLHRGRKLAASQIQGIVHLTASAVEGLNPEEITLVDIHGNILSGGGSSEPLARLTANQLDYKINIEKNLELRVQSMLERIMGRGKVTVRASVELDFLQEERMEEIYDPDSQVARSEQKETDSSVGAASISGVPGVQSNLPGKRSGSRGGYSAPESSRVSETHNFEINKITRKIVEPVGNLKKMSVAVAIDGTYETPEDGGKPQYVPRSAEELQKYSDLIKGAVGFNQERGDVVEVSSIPFFSGNVWEESQEMEAGNDRRFWIEVIKYILSGVALISIILFVLKPLIAWATTAIEIERGSFETPMSVSEMESAVAGNKEEKENKAYYRQEAAKFVESDPKVTAEFMRKWLKERG